MSNTIVSISRLFKNKTKSNQYLLPRDLPTCATLSIQAATLGWISVKERKLTHHNVGRRVSVWVSLC